MNRIIIATLAAAAAFLSTMAHGQHYDLDEQTDPVYAVPYLIAVETFSTDNDKSITVDGETYYEVWSLSQLIGDIGVRGDAGSGRIVYLRYELENAVFFYGSYTAGDRSNYLSQEPWWNIVGIEPGRLELEGGGHGRSWMVYSVTPNNITGFPAEHPLHFTLDGMAILPEKPVSLTYTAYLDLGDALQGRNPVVTKKADNIINSGRALRHDVRQGFAVALVAPGFTQITPPWQRNHFLGSLWARITHVDRNRQNAGGGFRHAHPPANTFIVTAPSELAKMGERGSTITFRGDFSVGSYSTQINFGDRKPLTTTENDEVLEKVTVATPDDFYYINLWIEVPENNATPIPEGDYTVAVDYETLPNRAIPPLDFAETVIGRILRQGTRVQIPFLTTYSGYSQRVVIVNRNTQPVSYAFSFVAEDGVTATPGEAAEGVVPAQGRAVLKATDIVSLEGKTRTAATLNMAAHHEGIDVATTTINMEDKGTDTVVLETSFSSSNTPPLPATPPSALQAKRR